MADDFDWEAAESEVGDIHDPSPFQYGEYQPDDAEGVGRAILQGLLKSAPDIVNLLNNDEAPIARYFYPQVGTTITFAWFSGRHVHICVVIPEDGPPLFELHDDEDATDE